MTKKTYIAFFIYSIAIALDQISKFYILHTDLPAEFTSWLNLVLVKNTGIVWGFSQSYGIYLALLGALSMTYIIKAIWKNHPYITALLLAGCIGNLSDRLFYGAVIDWIDIHAFNYHWPSFNLADSYLVICVFYIIGKNILNKDKLS